MPFGCWLDVLKSARMKLKTTTKIILELGTYGFACTEKPRSILGVMGEGDGVNSEFSGLELVILLL